MAMIPCDEVFLMKRMTADSEVASHSGETDHLATLAKALAHPARVEIVQMLLEKRSCIGCDIVDEIGLAQSTTSDHLRILKAAGIIIGEIERPRVCYSLNPTALESLRRFVDLVIATGSPASARF